MTAEIVQQLILAVALAIVSLIAFALRSLFEVGVAYLRLRIGETQFQRLKAYAETTVRSLEQNPVFKEFSGEKKKELATLAILQWAANNKIPADREIVDKFIEAAVQILNSERTQIDFTAVAGELSDGEHDSIVGGLN